MVEVVSKVGQDFLVKDILFRHEVLVSPFEASCSFFTSRSGYVVHGSEEGVKEGSLALCAMR
jgi:hypothetical protein